MNNINEILKEAVMAEHGEAKMEVYKRGWEEADSIKNYYFQMQFRLKYISEAVFYEDTMPMYVVFPELLKLYDEHEAEEGGNPGLFTYEVLWKYKWVLENAKDFYQISMQQFEAFKEDFKKRCLACGYSLRTYYQHSFSFYMRTDWKKAEEAYRSFLECKRDSLSDCMACERDTQVQYLLATDQEEEALRQAQDLFERKLTCGEVPEVTYGQMLRFYNIQICDGNTECIQRTADFCEKIRFSVSRKQIGKEYLGDILLYYSLVNPSKALPFYKKYCSYFEENKNPVQKIYFGLGAVKFLENMKGKKTFRMKMDSHFPFYQESGNYEVETLREHYETQTKSLIQKLDARNQNTYFSDIWNRVLGHSQEEI